MKSSHPQPYSAEKAQDPKLTAATVITGWFQRRKDAMKLLEALTEGTIILAEAGYRGHARRHWMTHSCGYSFRSSLKEISTTGIESCPYCHTHNVRDLAQFGSVAAVQELVTILVDDRVVFLPQNQLGGIDDFYCFHCNFHQQPFHETFRKFVAGPDKACPDCFFDDLLPKNQIIRIED